jgi:hypothetical protein
MTDLKEVTLEKAGSIIESRQPLGRFYCKENDRYVGIDNRDGDAWTEDFDSIQECMDWLADKYVSKEITLRAKVEENKAQYLERYGELNWQWVDEGLPNTIMDYHGSIGSVLDFTEDDWRACKENGWTLDEVLTLCDEEEFSPNGDSLEQFFSNFPDDMPKEDAIAAVEDFYTWFWKKLPKVKEILGNG